MKLIVLLVLVFSSWIVIKMDDSGTECTNDEELIDIINLNSFDQEYYILKNQTNEMIRIVNDSNTFVENNHDYMYNILPQKAKTSLSLTNELNKTLTSFKAEYNATELVEFDLIFLTYNTRHLSEFIIDQIMIAQEERATLLIYHQQATFLNEISYNKNEFQNEYLKSQDKLSKNLKKWKIYFLRYKKLLKIYETLEKLKISIKTIQDNLTNFSLMILVFHEMSKKSRKRNIWSLFGF